MNKLQFHLMLSIMGADVSLYGIDKNALPRLEEYKIRNALDLLSSDKKIKSYSINTANVKRQFLSPGEDEISEYIIGGGLRPKSKLKKIYSQAVEKNIIETISTEYIWWPEDYVK